MYNFIKTKLHRGRKRRWVYELSKGNCHINWFLTKKMAGRSKNEEINRKKSQKWTKKSRIIRQFWTWNGFSGSAKHCSINFRGLNFKIATKKQITSKKAGPLRQNKPAENGYLEVQFGQKLLFKKSLTKSKSHDQKTSLAQKKLAHSAILIASAFRSKVKTSSERIKKTLRKPILIFES